MFVLLIFLKDSVTLSQMANALNDDDRFRFEFYSESQDDMFSHPGGYDTFISIAPVSSAKEFYEPGEIEEKVKIKNPAIYMVQFKDFQLASEMFKTLWSHFDMVLDDDEGCFCSSYTEYQNR